MPRSSLTALHGMLGSPADWDFLRSSLPEFSSLESPNLRDPRWHADLASIGRHINLQTSGDTLIGYSMGARLALHALADNPSRWRAAVLVSAHPGLPESERPARLLADQAWADKARTAPWPSFLADWDAQPLFAASAPPPRSHLISQSDAIADAFDRWSLGRQIDFFPLLPNITTPILWITGARDQKFTALAQSSCKALPRAQHTIIPHAHHRPHLENPLRFLTSLQTFLSSLHI